MEVFDSFESMNSVGACLESEFAFITVLVDRHTNLHSNKCTA